jgi:hypothetical protein
VGLDAAMGYLVQPAAVQLVLYGLLALAAVLLRDVKSRVSTNRPSWLGPLSAGVLLIAGFAAPVLPYAYATGSFVPHQLRPSTFNLSPVITSVGARGASPDPLQFEAREGELLEIAVEASDPQGDDLTFSLVSIPVGSRPVYQFRLADMGERFVTISDDEKNALLETYSRAVQHYDGIACYAYAAPGVRAGLEPVHRFWSASRQRHFYTISQSEKDTVLTESPKDQWAYEGIAFYAFAPGSQPGDAAAVHRFWSEQTGHSWIVAEPGRKTAPVPDADAVDDGIAWYVHGGGQPPAGVSFEDGTLRWRPAPGQRGDYQFNIVVSDADMESCQLIEVTVRPGPSGDEAASHESRATSHESRARLGRHAGLRRLPTAADMLFDGTAELLMVFFFLPWCLGLYRRMRYEASRLERILTPAVIVVNAGLILARHMWVSPSSERRYCLGLIVLTIFYVPAGLELIARRLSRIRAFGSSRVGLTGNGRPHWFHILVAIGIGICLPKLLTPPYADKRSYLTAIQWLRENTRPEDVTAVPDSRLTFYAERRGLVYTNDVDPRRVDYIVRFIEKDAKAAVPTNWSQSRSLAVNDRRGRTLIIYKTHRHRE